MLTTIALTALIGGGFVFCGIYLGFSKGVRVGQEIGINTALDIVIGAGLASEAQIQAAIDKR